MDESVRKFLENCQIVVVAGGLGTGLRHRCGDDVPKALLTVNGKTLLDYCVELFAKAGCKDFVFLLGYLGENVQKYVGDGSKYSIRARYSMEKEKLGKGGALKMALDSGAIDRKKPSIIVYPDDLIINPEFPQQLARRHIFGVEKGALITLVSVKKTFYRYGSPDTDDEGFVVDFREKPPVELPANVAIYVLQPEAYRIIEELVNLQKKPVEFEDNVLPELIKRRIVFNFTIPLETWIPVNDEKEFRKAKKVMAENG
jgi:NDP-sugar pyrophosphorylase family protein